jgi:Family of unknown function (DUF5320)
MPGFDGSGPRGAGPMSGRGMGNCTGYNDAPQQLGFGYGRGFGGGRGFGRGGAQGWGGGYRRGAVGYYNDSPPPIENNTPLTASQEAQVLKAQLKQHRRALDEIQARLDEIESATKSE